EAGERSAVGLPELAGLPACRPGRAGSLRALPRHAPPVRAADPLLPAPLAAAQPVAVPALRRALLRAVRGRRLAIGRGLDGGHGPRRPELAAPSAPACVH